MTPVELSRTVLRAVRRAVEDGELRVVVPERASVTVPGAGGWGDYATNIALQLARPAGETPRRVAELLLPHLAGAHGVSGVEITGPGFLNISLGSTASTSLVAEILRRGPRYGFVDDLTLDDLTLEDLTLDDPTIGDDAHATGHGPHTPAAHLVRLHAPHEPRALVVMDVVARLLRSQGAHVRTSCETQPPEPAWATVLGISGVAPYSAPQEPSPLDLDLDLDLHVDVDVDVRPVPLPAPDVADLLALGRDAARWALLHPAAHDRPRPTADHLVQREANPLFRVRYAYARTRAVSRNAADLGFTAQPGDVRDTQDVQGDVRDTQDVQGDVQEVTTSLAQEVTTLLADHPRVLSRAATHRAPDLLARHLVAVADATLPFLPAVLPLGDEKPLAAHRARLALAEAAGAVLAGGLSLLGIDAPEHL
ncbi:DALR anticodon-binding domain-containing protein [Streptomyces sp. W16]|uniref:ArgS-related anticodon-binding protein NrtL n=1 Tax=Streptomyces sp. W16 TaxID=3076631 RepID=UPI00295BCFEF|nr:DALR anticodon-binding domain-containing protein [Streptomyces sp. W16]MDV9172316.1 DALR anticodon-binding domain-containing protein [Streptomyces sp. W16]